MRIGIDIDDTLTDTHEYVIALKKKYLPEYDPNEMLPEDIFKDFILKYDRLIHQKCSLKKGAKEALTYLKEQGHEIYIMSSRGNYSKESYEDSLNYLNRHAIPFDRLICNLGTKVNEVLANNIDLFIDDNAKILNELKNRGIDIIKMRRHDDKPSDLLTCNNWEEIINCIKEKFNG